MSFQAMVDGVQEEDFTVNFPSILPAHPAFLYELTGLGDYYSLKELNSEYLDFICWQVRLKTIGLVQVDQLDFLLTLLLGQIFFLNMPTSKTLAGLLFNSSALSNRMGSCPPGLSCPEKGGCSSHFSANWVIDSLFPALHMLLFLYHGF